MLVIKLLVLVNQTFLVKKLVKMQQMLFYLTFLVLLLVGKQLALIFQIL
jgi:hypothetical protein